MGHLLLSWIRKKFGEVKSRTKVAEGRHKILFILIIIVAVITVMYWIIFSRNRKNKSNRIDTVQKYKDSYLKNRDKQKNVCDENTGICNYVTKYNSLEDYREK